MRQNIVTHPAFAWVPVNVYYQPPDGFRGHLSLVEAALVILAIVAVMALMALGIAILMNRQDRRLRRLSIASLHQFPSRGHAIERDVIVGGTV